MCNKEINLQVSPFPAEEKRPATLVYRYAASMLDGLFVGLISLPIYILFAFLTTGEESIWLGIISTLISTTYAVYLTKTHQATWGKKYYNINVETYDRLPMTWGRAIKREVLGKFLSSLICGLGFVWALFNRERKTWHDMFAGTTVLQYQSVTGWKKFFAYLLTFGLVILAVLGILTVIVLVSINPSEQQTRAKDAGRISGVQQMGRSTQAYYVRNQKYPSLYNWSNELIDAGQMGKIPDAVKYGPSYEPCSSNLLNNTWCYNSNDKDAIVFSKLESVQRNSECKNEEAAYALFSVAIGRGGIVCSFNDPFPSGNYSFIQ